MLLQSAAAANVGTPTDPWGRSRPNPPMLPSPTALPGPPPSLWSSTSTPLGAARAQFNSHPSFATAATVAAAAASSASAGHVSSSNSPINASHIARSGMYGNAHIQDINDESGSGETGHLYTHPPAMPVHTMASWNSMVPQV
ncbi:hypothetical protein TrispH2_001084 [Trichoplax sp. H2]|nr:hypothetical protein TrispH2_001084 [Trichoplax sp. H2]|eukprot:RDD46740.1 hypothetical protein TrispH2_001084 [Trichoplax sp. H2]